MLIKDVINYLETLAPKALQENYDNSGLICGSAENSVSGIIVCLDAIEAVVDEAIQKNCNLIVAHHPILFSALKSLTGKNYVERTLIKAIQNNIAIYAIHTNLDNVSTGVNAMILSKLGAENLQILRPKENTLCKLYTFVPEANVEEVKNALFNAGAGHIGNYSEASFSSSGFGTFKGNDTSNPTIGTKGHREEIKELKVEVIFPLYIKNQLIAALKSNHPYEEVAYDIVKLENENQDTGSGMVGELSEAIPTLDFLHLLKEKFAVSCIKHTKITTNEIKKIAVCGGSGSFLLKDAIAANADIFISSDFKYHEYFDAENKIIIADIGHYESEQFTMHLLLEKLNKKFHNFAVFLTEVKTNPVHYYF
jgi:dinuclear metal center YbgI/SA1388 family protein